MARVPATLGWFRPALTSIPLVRYRTEPVQSSARAAHGAEKTRIRRALRVTTNLLILLSLVLCVAERRPVCAQSSGPRHRPGSAGLAGTATLSKSIRGHPESRLSDLDGGYTGGFRCKRRPHRAPGRPGTAACPATRIRSSGGWASSGRRMSAPHMRFGEPYIRSTVASSRRALLVPGRSLRPAAGRLVDRDEAAVRIARRDAPRGRDRRRGPRRFETAPWVPYSAADGSTDLSLHPTADLCDHSRSDLAGPASSSRKRSGSHRRHPPFSRLA